MRRKWASLTQWLSLTLLLVVVGYAIFVVVTIGCYVGASGHVPNPPEARRDIIAALNAPSGLFGNIVGLLNLPTADTSGGLPEVDGQQRAAHLATTRACVKSVGRLAAELVGAILVLTLAARVVVYFVYAVAEALQDDLEINAIKDSGAQTGAGSDVAELIRRNYISFTRPQHRVNSVHLVVGPKLDLNVPAELLEASQNLAMFAFLVRIVRPNRGFVLSGTLHARSAGTGAGLTLSLLSRRTGKLIETVTIWEADYNPLFSRQDAKDPGSYRRLATPAAFWAYFAILAWKKQEPLSGGNWLWPPSPVQERLGGFAVIGTRDWEACALNFVGSELRVAGERQVASQLFEKALVKDPYFAEAYFNRGALEIERAADPGDRSLDSDWASYLPRRLAAPLRHRVSRSQYETASRLLRKAVLHSMNAPASASDNVTAPIAGTWRRALSTRLRAACQWVVDPWFRCLGLPVPSKRTQTERMWFRAMYQLGAVDLYRILESECHHGAQREHPYSTKLVEEIEAARQKEESSPLRALLTGLVSKLPARIKPPMPSRPAATRGSLLEFLDELEPNARLLESMVSLCCACAQTAPRPHGSPALPTELADSMADVTPRVSYNLACYASLYAEWGGGNAPGVWLDQALDYLDHGLTLGYDAVRWANLDPALKPVRGRRRTPFRKLSKWHGPIEPFRARVASAGAWSFALTLGRKDPVGSDAVASMGG